MAPRPARPRPIAPVAIALLIAPLVALALGCQGAGPGWRVDAKAADEATKEGMLPVRFSGFQRVWLAPDLDLGRYERLAIAPPRIWFKREPTRGDAAIARSRRPTDPNFPLSERQQADFLRWLGDAFARELSRSDQFELAGEAGPGTLVVVPAIRDLVMLAPLGPVPDRTITVTTAAAEMMLVLELRDGASGEVVGRVIDRRRAVTPGSSGLGGHLSVPSENAAALRTTFSDWASQLQMRLDATRAESPELAARAW